MPNFASIDSIKLGYWVFNKQNACLNEMGSNFFPKKSDYSEFCFTTSTETNWWISQAIGLLVHEFYYPLTSDRGLEQARLCLDVQFSLLYSDFRARYRIISVILELIFLG